MTTPDTTTTATSPASGAAPLPATDLLDCDLDQVRDHLAAAYATRDVFAMWTCCQDEAGLLGDVDRLATEVGRLRADFATISDDLDTETAKTARLERDNRILAARNTMLALQSAAHASRVQRLNKLVGAELLAALDAARNRAALAEADHARLIRHARAALTTGDLTWLRSEFDWRGIGIDNGASNPLTGTAALAAPVIPGQRRPVHDDPAAA